MRSIVLAVVLALMGFAVHAQPIGVDVATISMSAPGVPRTVTDTVCVTDGNDLVCDRGVVITSSSRVGIGNASPSSTLHVSGTGQVDGTLTTTSMLIVSRTQADHWAEVDLISGRTTNNERNWNVTNNASSGNLYFRSLDDARNTQSIPATFLRDGRVGISNTDPAVTLHIGGSVRVGVEASATLAVCDANRTGAIRYTGGDFWFCRNGSAWESIAILSGGGGLADRITSGTASGVVAMAGGTVSFTTGGTSGTAYLDTVGRFVGAGVSTTGAISATSIYAGGALQLASPTAVTACTSTAAGTIRYNSPTTTLELCTGSGWQPMGVGIPAGTISAFASTTCPTGWSEYTAARGRFLRGIDNGAGNDPSGTRAPGSTQADLLASHSHASSLPTLSYPSLGNPDAAGYTTVSSIGAFSQPTSSAGGAETRPRNVAVTYCQFNGTSNGWNNPLSGGSTVAAGSTGQLQYNTGNAFDASAGLTWTNSASLLTVTGRVSATNISVTALTVNGVAITGGGGGSRLASMTDVTTTGVVSGSVLAFNSATSSWTALPLQQVMSTTTMVQGWPDAIRCYVTNPNIGYRTLFPQESPYTDGTYSYREVSSQTATNDRYVSFNSNGTFQGVDFYVSHNCNKTIAQLYADGQAFNFIGSANTSASAALGDRITSGTSSVVMNSATGIVSITQLGAVASYVHPSMGYVGPGVSTTGVVSSTALYLAKTASPCATLADEGKMFRNATSGRLQLCARRD